MYTRLYRPVKELLEGKPKREIKETVNKEIEDKLIEKGILINTVNRTKEKIFEEAAKNDAIIISNDDFSELCNINVTWKRLVLYNLLQFGFYLDDFCVPDDSWGRNGPHLDELLSICFNWMNYKWQEKKRSLTLKH